MKSSITLLAVFLNSFILVSHSQTDLCTLFPTESIESIPVLKGENAIQQNGEKENHGALEFFLNDTTGDDKIFEKVEIEASFPGGDEMWRKYLEKTLNDNTPLDNGAPIGIYKVIVQFIVDKEGNITGIKPLTNYGYGLEAEVVRVIRKGPKWTPAMQSGRMVKAFRKQPITFLVEEDGIDVQTTNGYVLKMGIDNTITIKIYKVKDENILVSLSNGTITRKEEGVYSAKVEKKENTILTIKDKKKNKELGQVFFEVQ